MTITPETCRTFTAAIGAAPECPSWLRDQAGLEFETVIRLPVVDATSDGQHASPMMEQKILAPDYLDFLREQIELNPRGPEWLAMLKTRLAKLEPFVGEQILTGTFHSKPHSATLRIRPSTNELIHSETV